MPQASSGKFSGSATKLDRKVRMSPSVLYAHQQNGFITRLTRSSVKHGMRRIRPILGCENRICRITMEQLCVQARDLRFSTHA
jgi:hypothetical protein